MRTCYVDEATRSIADLVHSGDIGLNNGGYVITRINVPAAHRGQGHARALLKRILADADAEQLTLYLEIFASGGLTHQQLEAWYQRYGFKKIYSGWYCRQPQERP